MMKFLEDSVVECAAPLGLVFAIFNIIWPGFGTFWSGFFGKDKGCCPKCGMEAVVIGICQSIAAGFLVGFLWSWYWAYLIFKKQK